MLAELLTRQLDRTLTRAADSLTLARAIRCDLAVQSAPDRPWPR